MWEVIQATVIASVLFVLIMTFGVIMLRMVKWVYLDFIASVKEEIRPWFKSDEEFDEAVRKWKRDEHIARLEQAARNGDLIAYDEWKRLTERN